MANIIYNNSYTATVVASAPELGLAFVQPTHGSPVASSLVMALYPHLSDAPGALWMTAYGVGSTVVCTRGYANGMEVAFITGICNVKLDALDNSGDYRLLYNMEKFTQSCEDSKSILRLLERMRGTLKASWVRNYANGASADMLPGDADILDKVSTVGIHVGRLVTCLHGSSTAFVDVGKMDGKVRLVGDVIEMHNVCMEQVCDRRYSVRNVAASPQEAFGMVQGPALVQDEYNETLGLLSDSALPLYRMQHMEGSVVQGLEDLVVGVPHEGGSPVIQHDADKEPPVLAKSRMDMSGEFSEASAHSIASVKTPFISAVTQLGYGGKPVAGGMYDDLREPHDADPEPNLEPDIPEKADDRVVTDAAINKLVGTLLSGPYKEAMLKALKESGLSVTGDQASLMGKAVDPEAVGGQTDKQEYSLPASIDITDPVTGRTQRYYSSVSFITQERDGSICICDGYGSEIRMCRGNIYISPALDLIMRPGRDFSVMAPGHLSLNSQESITINCNTDLYMRSVGTMKIAGATGGKGVVTLESNATTGPDNTGLPGLVLKADGNLSMTAAMNMYIGRNSNHGEGKNKVTSPADPGSIVFDAGSNGTCYARSASMTVDAGELTAGAFTMAKNDNDTGSITGTGITMNRESIGIYSKYVHMPASLNMTKMDGVMRVPLCRGGRSREGTFKTDNQPSLFVESHGVFGQDLVVNGTGKFNGHGKRGHALQAFGIISTTDDAELDPQSKSTLKHFKEQEMFSTTPNAAPAATAAPANAAAVAKTVYQDWFITGNRFAFPDSYGRDIIYVPGMVWQERARAMKNAGDAWKEQYMTDPDGKPTACYPGYRIWENACVSERGGKLEAQLNDGGYVTNTKHEAR